MTDDRRSISRVARSGSVRRASPESSPNRPSRRWLVRCSTTTLASAGAGAVIAFVINGLHLTHGEQTPTYLGVERTKFVARYGATPLYWFAWLLSPVIWFGDAVAKWTLRRFGRRDDRRVARDRDRDHRNAGRPPEPTLRPSSSGRTPGRAARGDTNAFTVGERPVEDVMTDIDDVVFLADGVGRGEPGPDRVEPTYAISADRGRTREIRRYHLRPDDRRPDRRPPSRFGHVRRPRDAADNALC